MQLRLIRFDQLVLLLVSLIHAKALEKLSPVEALTPAPSPTAMPFQQVSRSRLADNQNALEGPGIDGLAAQLDQETRRRQERRDMRGNMGGKAIAYSPIHSETLLAEKLAKDALHSKETQDKIAELTSLKDEHKQPNPEGRAFHPIDRKTAQKSKGHAKHKGHANRKRKKHRKHERKHRHPKRRLGRHNFKKGSRKTARKRKSGESLSGGRDNRRGLGGKDRSGKSISSYRRKRSDKNPEKTPGGSLDREPVSVEGLPGPESTRKKHQDADKRDMNHVKRSHIIAKLMRTTTRDPNKKKLGDQGVEYSEYYSDNDAIISPDVRARPKLNDVAENSEEGPVRSVREAVDGNLLDKNYYEISDDGERSKRDDPRAVSVMEDPSDSMDYVDNTYGPAQVDGIVDAGQMSPYDSNYNYIPYQGSQYNNPAVIPGVGQQIFSNVPTTFNQNPPVIESPLKVPADIIPSISNELNIDPMLNNQQPVAQGQTGLSGNVLSPLPQPQLVQDNIPRYVPFAQFPSPVASSVSTLQGKTVGNYGVIVPEGEKLAKVTPATSSSALVFKPSPSYDTSGEIGRLLPLGTTAGGTSLASFDSPEILSRLQDIRHQLAPEVIRLHQNDGADNVPAGGQVQAISSREVPSKKGKKKGSESKKSEGQASITPSEDAVTKKHRGNKASSHAASTSPPGIRNDTKAVASQILTEIMDELEQLRLENPKNEDREGLPCRLTGSWVTARAGVRIDMKVSNHSVQVSLDHLTSPVSTEALLNVTWNVTGFAPFKRGGPFTLLATNNHTKTLAVFVGACKVCQGIDTIEGSWTVSREPRDCRDFQMSTQIFNEIFRRTRLFSAIKDKQSKHETTMITTSSSSTSTTESSAIKGVSENTDKSHNRTTENVGME